MTSNHARGKTDTYVTCKKTQYNSERSNNDENHGKNSTQDVNTRNVPN